MLENELIDLLEKSISLKCETPNIEFKTAKNGCPERLYDTLSSFSNTRGGTIIFGVDEKNGYNIVGINNPQELQKKITEQIFYKTTKSRLKKCNRTLKSHLKKCKI